MLVQAPRVLGRPENGHYFSCISADNMTLFHDPRAVCQRKEDTWGKPAMATAAVHPTWKPEGDRQIIQGSGSGAAGETGREQGIPLRPMRKVKQGIHNIKLYRGFSTNAEQGSKILRNP